MSRSTHPPLIRKLDCLQLPVSDLEAGVVFTSVGTRGHLGGVRIRWGCVCPTPTLSSCCRPSGRTRRVDLLVEDVRAAVERFVAAGGRVVVHPFPIEIGLCAVVADRHGNKLELLDMSNGPLDPDAELSTS